MQKEKYRNKKTQDKIRFELYTSNNNPIRIYQDKYEALDSIFANKANNYDKFQVSKSFIVHTRSFSISRIL